MKLWQKDKDVNFEVEKFTVGRDLEMDTFLAKSDILGSLAHTRMLNSVGLLSDDDLALVQQGLKRIFEDIENGNFVLEAGFEDIHSYVEIRLVQEVGEAGAKIHSGRSRNDQVLLDIKLYLRDQLKEIVEYVVEFFNLLQTLSERHKDVLMPGYTHLQIAMPSSFGLWFGAYAESLIDDIRVLKCAYDTVNRNPLGSGAGYGSSFPLDREMTTSLLGFDGLNYNVVYAQMGRGKCERLVSQAMASVASTISKFAYDNCMFMSQNFGFVSYPDEFTTGSSIMPHKKNPDVWELVRGKCNVMQSLPNTIIMLTNNMPIGYNRDMQLLKEMLFPAIEELKNVMEMSYTMLSQVKINGEAVNELRYDYIFSVEKVNKLVLDGVPFREAYRSVGRDIELGNFEACREVNHTHVGSIGNLCNEQIKNEMDRVLKGFCFEKAQDAISNLLK